MNFSPYDHQDDNPSFVKKDNGYYIVVEGSQAYQSGEYMNEKNVTMEMKVSDSQIEALIDMYDGGDSDE